MCAAAHRAARPHDRERFSAPQTAELSSLEPTSGARPAARVSLALDVLGYSIIAVSPKVALAQGPAKIQKRSEEIHMLLTILIVLLVLSLAGGGWGYSHWGFVGMSPAGVILLVLAILWLTGHL